MTSLTGAIDDYLALRAGLGFTTKGAATLLASFAAFSDQHGADVVRTGLAVAWATTPTGVNPIWWRQRLSTVREFARYLATIDPDNEIPATDLIPARYDRRPPYLYSDGDITALMAAARTLAPPLRAATYTTLIGLLTVTGLRVGEAIALVRDDLDTSNATLTVRDGKNGRSREIPLHPTSVEALLDYMRVVKDAIGQPVSPNLLVSIRGTGLCQSAVNPAFRTIVKRAGLQPHGAHCNPRLHDARHSLAMRTLIGWYQQNADIEAKIPLLSEFLGHANPASTYWYLQEAPELFGLVANRLEQLTEALS